MNRQLDVCDRRVIGALLAHPRATNAQIAEAAHTSAATVSRRIGRLHDEHRLWVTAVVDSRATGRSRSLFVRLRCAPGKTLTTVEQLAAWAECGSVKLVTGSVDAVAEISYTSQDHLLDLTLDKLPALNGVQAIWSNQVIRRYATPHQWMPPLLPAPAIEALRALRTDRWQESDLPEPAAISPAAAAIAEALTEDARQGWRSLARRCGVSPATARNHTEQLMERGVLRTRTVVEPATIGLKVTAFIWLNVIPTQLGKAGTILADRPEVLMMAATTGDRNLCGEIAVASEAELYNFISSTIGGLPGLQHADVAISLRSVKRAGRRALDPD